jgi:hypothetical protein
MSAPRGRVIRGGGMAVDPQGASARTEGPPEAPITRPAFRTSPGGTNFAATGVGGPKTAAFLDLSGVPFWRLLYVAVAALWLGIVFVNFGRGGISGGVRV